MSAKGGEQGSDDGYDGATDDGQGLFGAFFHIETHPHPLSFKEGLFLCASRGTREFFKWLILGLIILKDAF